MLRESADLVIIGGGPAARAAAAVLPEARILARPGETVWHAAGDTLWIERADGIAALTFARLLLCADEPLLLLSLGCRFQGGRPVVDARGETSRPGLFAAGRVLGAADPETAAAQAQVAARALATPALAGLAPEESIPAPPAAPLTSPARLDPVGIAALLEEPPGPARNRAALAQAARLGALVPARSVGFAALAAAAGALPPRPVQADAGRLS